jgi:hypothetical protein
MTDDTMRPEPSDRPEQPIPQQSSNDAPQQQADASDAPVRARPSGPGRRPLFRR